MSVTEDQATETKRVHNVDYEVDEFVDSLPGGDMNSNSRSSILRNKVSELRDNAAFHSPNSDGKDLWRTIAVYESSGSATGAMQALRNFFGREGSGFYFATRTVGDHTTLWASYKPKDRTEGYPEPGSVPQPESKGRGRPKAEDEANGTSAEDEADPNGTSAGDANPVATKAASETPDSPDKTAREKSGTPGAGKNVDADKVQGKHPGS